MEKQPGLKTKHGRVIETLPCKHENPHDIVKGI